MTAKTIIIVDDDHIFLQVLARSMRRRGYEAITADSVARARLLLERYTPDLAVIDLKMKGESGLNLVPELSRINKDIKSIVLTGYASIATAVEAIRLGALDYLCKPADTDQILAALNIDNENPNRAVSISETPMSVDRLEWEYIQKVLRENNDNISATARSLGMHRRTLQRKLSKNPAKAP